MKRQILTVIALVSSFALAQAIDTAALRQKLANLDLSAEGLSNLKAQAQAKYQEAKAAGTTRSEFIQAVRSHVGENELVQDIKAKAGARWDALTPDQQAQVKQAAKGLASKVLTKIQDHLAQ